MVVGLKGRGVDLTYRDVSRCLRKREHDRRVYTTLDRIYIYVCIYMYIRIYIYVYIHVCSGVTGLSSERP